VIALIGFGIGRLVRRPIAVASSAGTPAASAEPRWRRAARYAYRGYVDVVVPIAIVLLVPAYFATDWSVMARIDIGQVLLAIAALRVLDGVVRVGRLGIARHRRPKTTAAALATT